MLKEQFKQDLKLRKEFLNKVQGLRQTQRINKALSDLNPEDDTDDWIQKLNEESAFAEAKADLAMDDTLSKHMDIPIEGPATPRHSEEEMQKIMAESLVEQMKAQMREEAKLSHSEEYLPDDTTPEEDASKSKGTGRKTLGDFD